MTGKRRATRQSVPAKAQRTEATRLHGEKIVGPKRRTTQESDVQPHPQVARSAKDDVLVFTCASASSARAKKLSALGVEVFPIRARRGRPNLDAVLEELGRRDILSVMLEAGPLLNQAALEANVIEKVRLFYAPTLVGLGSSLPGLPAGKRSRMPRVRELSDIRTENFGPDFAVEGYLRDVYRDH